MKYFTKEELEDITKELIENPTHETLKKLNEKYNVNSKNVILPNETLFYGDSQSASEKSTVDSQINENEIKIQEPSGQGIQTIEISNPTVVEPVLTQIPNDKTPNIEVPQIDTNQMNNISKTTIEAPTFELPKIDMPVENNQNSFQINFTGNLFETQQPLPNLMQTTDNFNSIPNVMTATDVPVTGTPFFGPHIAVENNPIPVSQPVNNMSVNQPSMFGQLEQNNM